MKLLMIANLQRFYSFEMGAIALYETLAQHVEDEEIRDYLLKFRDIEATHATFWNETLRQFGRFPTKRFGVLTALGSRMSAHGIGVTQQLSGLLRVTNYIENLAIWDYGFFVKRYERNYPDLAKDIWNLRVEEELHGIWLREKSKELIQNIGRPLH